MLDRNLKLTNAYPMGDDWQVEEEIGRGSFGVVYRAVPTGQTAAGPCALKWIPLPADEKEVRRLAEKGWSKDRIESYYDQVSLSFQEEIKLLEQLRDCPNVVHMVSCSVQKRQDAIGYDIFILTELLTPLEKSINENGMTYGDILRLGEDLCSALSSCSKLGIVHKDIKPENIFVDASGRYKLGDFGIARQLQQEELTDGEPEGNLAYMAPEVYHHHAYDSRADMYSLGLVLYELVNHRKAPFMRPEESDAGGAVFREALKKRMDNKPIPKPDLPDGLDRFWDVLQTSCAFDPRDRWTSPEQMLRAIRELKKLTWTESTTALMPLDETDRHNDSSYYPVLDRGHDTKQRDTVMAEEDSAFAGNSLENRIQTHTRQAKETPKKKRTGIIIGAISAAVVLLTAVLIAVLLPGMRKNWLRIADIQAEVNTVQVVCEGGQAPYNLTCEKDGQIIQSVRLSTAGVAALNGLVPGETYLIRVKDAKEKTVETTVSTKAAAQPGNLPLVTGVLLFTGRREYLKDDNLLELDSIYFDRVGESLHLADAPPSTQNNRVFVSAILASSTEEREWKLTITLASPDGSLFSKDNMLQIPRRDESFSIRYYVDDLFEEMYAKYGGWPEGDSSIQLFLNGTSIGKVRFQLQ